VKELLVHKLDIEHHRKLAQVVKLHFSLFLTQVKVLESDFESPCGGTTRCCLFIECNCCIPVAVL